jgi:accessory gene regulator B
VYAYGLELFVSTVVNVAALMALAIAFGKVAQTAALLAVMLPLQSCAGGYHAKTHLNCFLIMVLGWFPAMGLMAAFSGAAALVACAFSLAAVFALAPVRHVNVTMSERRAKTMKICSRLIAVAAAALSAALILSGARLVRLGVYIAASMAVLALSMLAAYLRNRRK